MSSARQLRCELGGEPFDLFPDKAAYWVPQRTLLVADVHLGKSATFRAAGLGVPESIGPELDRLSALIGRSGATRLLVLGDLFHAPAGQSPSVRSALADWRSLHPDLAIAVTRGNHDRACDQLLEEFGVDIEGAIELGGMRFQHEVSPDVARRGGYRLGGHIHPAVRLSDPTGSLRMPCFWFGPSDGVLPAFGEFTGTHVIERVPGDRVFAIAGDRVVEIDRARPSSARRP